MTHYRLLDSDARLVLSTLADGWVSGRKARTIRKPCGMTGTLAGDRRTLNADAVQLVAVNVPSLLDLLVAQRRAHTGGV